MDAISSSELGVARHDSPIPRLLSWLGVVVVIALDAAISTPVGLPLLYMVPIAWAGLRLRRTEAVALALLCAAARILFGPVGDPLELARTTLHVSEEVQIGFNAATSLIGYAGLAWLVANMARQQRMITGLRTVSREDPLTGLANRRTFDDYLRRHEGRAAAVIAVDLDRFKSINDGHGHAAGDKVLVELAKRLRRVVRAGDLLARIGGEEFVVVLRDAPPAVARRVGEHICEVVREAPFDLGTPLIVTTSVGAAVGPLGTALIAQADAALYEAKHGGRDRCVIAGDEAS